jgi:hypothetical protein
MDNEELAQYITEVIIPKYLQFTINYTEHNQDGSFTVTRTERAEAIYNDILKLLEENKKDI